MHPYTPPLYNTAPLTAALANLYAPYHTISPHYYQAYLQASSNHPPRTTVDGYTLSSTYVPGPANPTTRTAPTPRRAPTQTHSQTAVRPISNPLTYGSWYQPGNNRCARPGCPFSGSRKSVEIHMMDRHFVFPHGWERNKRDDWDADPSLKGKPVAIQGTTIVLDTPEAIDSWVAERKRRFPTEENIRAKKRKLEEAVARGQLTHEDMGGAGARKGYRQTATYAEGGSRGSRGQRHQRGRYRRNIQPRAECNDALTTRRPDSKADDTRDECLGAASSSDDDGAPEVVSSKTPLSSMKNDVTHQSDTTHLQQSARRVPQPKRPPRNPFATRPTLLRNVPTRLLFTCPTILMSSPVKLLLPEIRITVSNLSQAIHFLVENDFLHGVELRPGESQERMIEVLDSSDTLPPVGGMGT